MKLDSNLARFSNVAQPPKTEKQIKEELEQKMGQQWRQQTEAEAAAAAKSAKEAMDMLEYQGVLNTIKLKTEPSEDSSSESVCFGKINFDDFDELSREEYLSEFLQIPVEENKDKTLAELIEEGKINEANRERFMALFENFDETIKDKVRKYEQTGNYEAMQKLLDKMFEKYKDETFDNLVKSYPDGKIWLRKDRGKPVSAEKLIENLTNNWKKAESDIDDTTPDCKIIPPNADDATVLPAGVRSFKINHEQMLADALADGSAHLLTMDEVLKMPVEENKDKTLAELIEEGKITEENKSRFVTLFEHFDKVDQSIKDKIYHYTYEVTDGSDELEKLIAELFEKYKDVTLGELTENYPLGEQYVFTDGMTFKEMIERYGA